VCLTLGQARTAKVTVRNICRDYSEPQLSSQAAPRPSAGDTSGLFSLWAMRAIDHTLDLMHLTRLWWSLTTFIRRGVEPKLANCHDALSANCAVISNYVTMQKNFEFCNTVPQQYSSAAVVTVSLGGLQEFRDTSPIVCLDEPRETHDADCNVRLFDPTATLPIPTIE
jgi:hypothetical protein